MNFFVFFGLSYFYNHLILFSFLNACDEEAYRVWNVIAVRLSRTSGEGRGKLQLTLNGCSTRAFALSCQILGTTGVVALMHHFLFVFDLRDTLSLFIL